MFPKQIRVTDQFTLYFFINTYSCTSLKSALSFPFKDKTFGIKNKKGAKQQKFIQQVEKQVKSGGVNPRKLEDPNVKKLEKEKKLKEQKELALIFKPVQMQKIDKGIEYIGDCLMKLLRAIFNKIRK